MSQELSGWVTVPWTVYCDICGKAVKLQGTGSHKRKHPGEKVSYSFYHPKASAVFLQIANVRFPQSYLMDEEASQELGLPEGARACCLDDRQLRILEPYNT